MFIFVGSWTHLVTIGYSMETSDWADPSLTAGDVSSFHTLDSDFLKQTEDTCLIRRMCLSDDHRKDSAW